MNTVGVTTKWAALQASSLDQCERTFCALGRQPIQPWTIFWYPELPRSYRTDRALALSCLPPSSRFRLMGEANRYTKIAHGEFPRKLNFGAVQDSVHIWQVPVQRRRNS